MKISYGITVHNEINELNKLLELLTKNIDDEDEIVVCVDNSGQDQNPSLVEVFDRWSPNIVYQRKLDGNFAEHKNSVIENSSGDYIFHIDADEYPNEILLQQLKEILEIEGMKEEHIQRWGWRVTENGWVNYPDYQSRVFRRDSEIRWERPLHELIRGAKTYAHLPPHEELSLYHPKTMQKQEAQNRFYNQNFSREMNVRK